MAEDLGPVGICTLGATPHTQDLLSQYCICLNATPVPTHTLDPAACRTDAAVDSASQNTNSSLWDLYLSQKGRMSSCCGPAQMAWPASLATLGPPAQGPLPRPLGMP